jgi:hypothetical protein
VSEEVDELQREREAKLPGWARAEYARLRSELRYANEALGQAIAAAQAAAGENPSEGAPITVTVGDVTFGLPWDADIAVGSLLINAARQGGIKVEDSRLAIVPVFIGQVWIHGGT